MKEIETLVTIKGTPPQAIRERCGIEPGAVLVWSVERDMIQARKKPGALNDLQTHILRPQ